MSNAYTCPYCGSRITPFAAGCAYCGADLDVRRNQSPSLPQRVGSAWRGRRRRMPRVGLPLRKR
jgi:DNA-directed RNA polymerase subunit RPC12/RpoP